MAITTEPLVAGDRLSKEEFLSRAEADRQVRKAELIGGRVYIMSPLRDEHAEADIILNACFLVYSANTPGCAARSNATCVIGKDIPQPDAYLRVLETHGGKSRVGTNGYLQGPPELVAEVCQSSSAYDLYDKKDIYQLGGVEEYVVVLLKERQFRALQLVRGQYKDVSIQPDGIFRSKAFQGLWIDSQAVLSGNANRALEVLNAGMESVEHATFVKLLASKKQ